MTVFDMLVFLCCKMQSKSVILHKRTDCCFGWILPILRVVAVLQKLGETNVLNIIKYTVTIQAHITVNVTQTHVNIPQILDGTLRFLLRL